MILSEILFEEILFKEIDDFLHHWLHLVVAVDEQRIVGSAWDRPAIQPRVTIVDTPEGNTTDDILVTLYNLEEIGRAHV